MSRVYAQAGASSWKHLLADGGVQAMERMPVGGLVKQIIPPHVAVSAISVEDFGIGTATGFVPGGFDAVADGAGRLEPLGAFLLQRFVGDAIILQGLLEL